VDGGKPKYSAALLIPKSDTATIKAINDAVEAAKKTKWGANVPNLKPTPLRDGLDATVNGRAPIASEADYMVLSSSNHQKPAVVGRDGHVSMEQDLFYAGAIVNARISVYAYNGDMSKGIAFGLEGVQFSRDAARLDSRPDPSAMFGAISDDDQDMLG